MDVVVWTLVFLGGNLLILAFLVVFAAKKDREKAREKARSSVTEPDPS